MINVRRKCDLSKFMAKKKIANSTEEFDRRFDDGEDIHDLIDLSKAKIDEPVKSQ